MCYELIHNQCPIWKGEGFFTIKRKTFCSSQPQQVVFFQHCNHKSWVISIVLTWGSASRYITISGTPKILNQNRNHHLYEASQTHNTKCIKACHFNNQSFPQCHLRRTGTALGLVLIERRGAWWVNKRSNQFTTIDFFYLFFLFFFDDILYACINMYFFWLMNSKHGQKYELVILWNLQTNKKK